MLLLDRYCRNSKDPCGDLQAAAQIAIANAQGKLEEMLNDDQKLFTNAFSTPNPSVTGTNTTWVGHRADLGGRIVNILAMISLGQKLGCDMSAEIALASNLFVPLFPHTP